MMSQEKKKRLEIKPVSAIPSLSEMFLEATNQLKGTELSPDDIRNYTLSRYNVDVIKCMKDINMLTRFSEIKLPNIISRKYSKKCPQRRSVNAKCVKRVATKKSRRTNLNKRKTVESKRKVAKSKRSHSTTMSRAKRSKKTCLRNSSFENDQMKSRISLIRLIRNRSSIGKENEKIYASGENNASAKLQASQLRSKNVVGDNSSKVHSNAPAECKALETETSSLDNSTLPKRDASGISEDDVKIRFRDYPERQNGITDKQDSLILDNKILKAGYAVKNFIQDLGTKCASSLMFSNQRRFDKDDRKVKENMEEGPMYHKLRKVRIDLVYDNMKTETACAPNDDKPSMVLGSNNAQRNKVTQNFKCGRSQEDREMPVAEINRDLQDVKGVGLGAVDPGQSSAETDQTLQPMSTNIKAIKAKECFIQSPTYEEEKETKVQQSVTSPTEVHRNENVVKQTRFAPYCENGNETENTNSGRITNNQSKKKSKETIHSFQNRKKSIKTISKQKKRSVRDTMNFGNSRIRKKTVKRINPSVKFADECGQNCSLDSPQAQNSILKNCRKEKSNRIEVLEHLLKRRRIMKKKSKGESVEL